MCSFSFTETLSLGAMVNIVGFYSIIFGRIMVICLFEKMEKFTSVRSSFLISQGIVVKLSQTSTLAHITGVL